MRWLPALVALLLLLAVVPAGTRAATAEGAAAGWRVVVTLDSATLRPQKAFEAFDTSSLNLYDFNGDGVMEIVSNNDNNRVYVIDPRPPGRLLAELETFHYNQSKWPVRELNPVSIGNLYGDGRPCMVVPNSASFLTAFCYNAAASTGERFVFDKMWETKVDAADHEPDFYESHPWMNESNNPSTDGHAYLADADGDGKMEVFLETDGYPGQFAFNHDGSYRWHTSFADGNAGAKVLDIDGDKRKEAVFVSDAGMVTVYDASTGKVKWNFESRKHGAFPGSVPVLPLIADLHGDGKYEIVFGARNVSREMSDPQWVNKSHARYFALNHKGQLLWNVSYDWGNPLTYNHPAPADVNGDGVLDAVFLDWNTVGHKPGDWNTTSRPSNLFVLDGRDGSPIWHKGIAVYWSNKDFVIASLGSGQRIIAPTARGADDGLGVYDLKTGDRQGWFPLEWQASRGPVAGNVYGDGKLALVVPISKKSSQPNYRSLDVGLREGKLVVIATDASYDVTFSANFLNSEDQKEKQVQGSVGVAPTPIVNTTPPTTPPTPEPSQDENNTPPVNQTPPTPIVNETNETPPGGTTTTTTTTTTTQRPTGTTPPQEATGENDAPGPGAALLVAAVAALAVLARRRR